MQHFDHPILQSIQQLASGDAKTITYQGIHTYQIQKSHFIDRGFARHFVMIEKLTTNAFEAICDNGTITFTIFFNSSQLIISDKGPA